MQDSPLTIKQLMRRSGVTLSQVANASETTVSDVSKLLNDNLREKVQAAALRLVVAQNKEVKDYLIPLEGYSEESEETEIVSMWEQDYRKEDKMV
ncbi:uncharacterized protein METZ01_LOCUS299401 [marine metagenome]|uniref:Uncharacterized protein n=1 Tax=marine metagenome TaxID=408172 RepID=A0A382MFN1_9ZZZZ